MMLTAVVLHLLTATAVVLLTALVALVATVAVVLVLAGSVTLVVTSAGGGKVNAIIDGIPLGHGHEDTGVIGRSVDTTTSVHTGG